MSRSTVVKIVQWVSGSKMGLFGRRTNARNIQTPEDAIAVLPSGLQDMSKEELIKLLMIYRRMLKDQQDVSK